MLEPGGRIVKPGVKWVNSAGKINKQRGER